MKRFHLTATLMLFASCLGLSAQSETKYERGATYLENTVPPSPEPASIVKYADVPFIHSAGMAEYDVPFYTLQSRELSIPIGLHYASGGIKLDEIAGVAGLGWTLNAGGCITRTVMDMPDEYVPLFGPFHHEMPSGSLLEDLESMEENTATLNFLRDVVWNRVDVGLDRYSYSVCGLSGSFVIQDDGTVFQLSGDGVLIDYVRDAESGSVDVFTLTGPDGIVYTFSVKELASRDGRGMTSTGPMNAKLDKWTAPTAWHLTQMRSRSGLETAEFTYSEPAQWNRSERTVIETMSYDTGKEIITPDRSVSSRNVISVYEARVLTGISLNGHTVSFEYDKSFGSRYYSDSSYSQQNFPFRLNRISVHISGTPVEVCSMKAYTAQAPFDGRVVLNGLEMYRDDKLDDKWNFAYKGVGRSVSRGSQDWYGYYNGENELSDNVNSRICPYEFSSQGANINLVKGYPNQAYADYMSLMSVDNDGAETIFIYEGNTFSTAYNTYSIGVRVQKIILPGEFYKPVRVRYFSYESPEFTGESVPSPDMYCTSQIQETGIAYGSATYNCQLTLHDSPVCLGPSIRDTRVYYRKVCEDIASPPFLAMVWDRPDTNTSRIVYEYDLSDIRPFGGGGFSRFPDAYSDMYGTNFNAFIPTLSFGVRKGYEGTGPAGAPVLKRKEEYAYEDGSYRLVSSLDYVYDATPRGGILVDYYATQVFHGYITTAPNFDEIYHFPIYAGCKYERRPIKEVRVGYHASGNDTTVVNTSYVSRDSMSDPIRVSSVSMHDGGETRSLSYSYPDKRPQAEIWASVLASQHCLSVPVWRGMTYVRDSILIVRPNPSPASIDDVLVPPHYPLPIPTSSADMEELTQYGWFDVLGGQALLPSSHVEKTLGVESWREDVLTRDSRGAITSVKEKGSPQTVILWGYGRRLPVAVIENASISEVYEALGGREVLIEASAGLDVPSDSYLQLLADLRTELPNAHVTTYTHIPGKGVESVTDPAGMRTTFEYDHAGRLTCIRDNDGNKVEEYDYSLMADADKRRHMRSRVFRSADGQQFSEDVRWWDVYGRTLQDISIAASGSGADLVTAYGSDFMMHDDVKTWLPYPVQNTAGAFQAEAENAAAGYHGNDLAYSFKNYEVSSRDRVISTALPGYAGEHETSFETDVLASMGSFMVLSPNYIWKDGHVERTGWYASDELVVEKTTDADGRVTSVCKDHFGKTIRTSVGNNGSTHYVYDLYDRLRAVIGSGIELSDTLNMWRYDYDSLGRMSSKGIPGSVREYYTYDDEDRVIAILRDGVLKEMEYDAFGRVLKVWQTLPGGQRVLLEQNIYDTYQSGVTGADPKGMKTLSRIAELAPDGKVMGYAKVTYSYDERKRPVKVVTRHTDGYEYIEEAEYTFAGEKSSSTSTFIYGNRIDVLSVDYTYDQRGRLKSETATLTLSGSAPQTAKVIHSYDALGRPSGISSLMQDCPRLASTLSYTLQGWSDTLSVTLGNSPLFLQYLGYDAPSELSEHVPQYSGMVSMKREIWPQPSGPHPNSRECYVYDHAGRLAKSGRQESFREYTYDSRGNILSETLPGSAGSFGYLYDGESDRLISLITSAAAQQDTLSFTHDALGRMTFDGTTGQSMTYNPLDLVGNISRDGTTLVNYFYLSDGTKLSALDGSGEGLVYRGPFVYRKSSGSNASSSLTLESAAFGGGRLTPDGALLYVTDYLGSVRAVVDGKTGELYKAAKYSAFGDESQVMVSGQGSTPAHALATAALPTGLTLRDAYTGKEAQNPDFSTGYTDFGARQYSPTLRRWMTPDPLSEKYYGVSPYAFCDNNPVNFVDPDGRDIYRYDDKSGTFHLYQETNDDFDQVARFRYNKDTGDYELKTNKDGEIKIRMDNIEKGILSDGINLLTDSQVWSTDEVSIEGFQNFIVAYSDMIGREMGGYYYSETDGTNIKYINSGMGKNNTYTMSYPGPGIFRVLPDLHGKVVPHTNWHTHLSYADNKLEPSEQDRKFKRDQSKHGLKRFIILTGGSSPIEY